MTLPETATARNETDVAALVAELDSAIQEIRTAFGAPGDHGDETPAGRALFRLYKAQASMPWEMLATTDDLPRALAEVFDHVLFRPRMDGGLVTHNVTVSSLLPQDCADRTADLLEQWGR